LEKDKLTEKTYEELSTEKTKGEGTKESTTLCYY
jgi:hypothetical protein